MSTHVAPLTPASSSTALPIIAQPMVPTKRGQVQGSEPLPQQVPTPKSVIEDPMSAGGSCVTADNPGSVEETKEQPPKKKRRVALTRVGDIGV